MITSEALDRQTPFEVIDTLIRAAEVDDDGPIRHNGQPIVRSTVPRKAN